MKTSKELKDVNKYYDLNNGMKIPTLGFGTWQIKNGKEAYESVKKALEVGYRHLDTAEAYRNEESVGKAIRDSGILRENIFVTTKIANTHHTYESAKVAINDSLKRLGLNYIDLYLIHWPNPIDIRPNYEKRNKAVYQAMEEAYLEGKIKALGVSNFHPHHLEALLKTAQIKPTVNQIYINPGDMQEKLVMFNQEHNLLTVAYSPLGTGEIFENEVLKKMASKYQRTVAQIALRWSLQHGYLPLPKSITPARIEENFKVFDFKLEDEDMVIIDALKGITGPAPNPDQSGF